MHAVLMMSLSRPQPTGECPLRRSQLECRIDTVGWAVALGRPNRGRKALVHLPHAGGRCLGLICTPAPQIVPALVRRRGIIQNIGQSQSINISRGEGGERRAGTGDLVRRG